ncbi:hypothetical protein WDU94_013937 [Cyamophila willieti]
MKTDQDTDAKRTKMTIESLNVPNFELNRRVKCGTNLLARDDFHHTNSWFTIVGQSKLLLSFTTLKTSVFRDQIGRKTSNQTPIFYR